MFTSARAGRSLAAMACTTSRQSFLGTSLRKDGVLIQNPTFIMTLSASASSSTQACHGCYTLFEIPDYPACSEHDAAVATNEISILKELTMFVAAAPAITRLESAQTTAPQTSSTLLVYASLQNVETLGGSTRPTKRLTTGRRHMCTTWCFLKEFKKLVIARSLKDVIHEIGALKAIGTVQFPRSHQTAFSEWPSRSF